MGAPSRPWPLSVNMATQADELLNAALATGPGYGGVGLATFPVRGKTPLTAHGFKDASKDPAQLAAWLAQFPNAGIAAPTGQEIEPGRSVVVFDADRRNGGSLSAFEEEHGALPATWTTITPGGTHTWLSVPSELRIRGRKLDQGFDLKAVGGYVVLPPSLHPSGERYKWALGRAPWEIPLAPAPEWFIALAMSIKSAAGARRSGTEWAALLSSLGEGSRDVGLTTLAGILFRDLPAELAYQLLHVANEARCRPPLSSEQVDKIANSIAGREADRQARS